MRCAGNRSARVAAKITGNAEDSDLVRRPVEAEYED
jgi:hypothetical protein